MKTAANFTSEENKILSAIEGQRYTEQAVRKNGAVHDGWLCHTCIEIRPPNKILLKRV